MLVPKFLALENPDQSFLACGSPSGSVHFTDSLRLYVPVEKKTI